MALYDDKLDWYDLLVPGSNITPVIHGVKNFVNDPNFKEDLADFIGWGSERRAYERELQSSNTAYQRAVADMRDAGLNPYLAYQQGGANSAVAMASKGHLKDLISLVGTAFNLASGLTRSANGLSRTAFKMQNRPNVTNNNYFMNMK